MENNTSKELQIALKYIDSSHKHRNKYFIYVIEKLFLIYTNNFVVQHNYIVGDGHAWQKLYQE